MQSTRPDVIILGSGQAGVPLAARLASAGKRVVLFERGDLGGTCVNVGCTPTKTMIASARAAHVARTASRLGVRAGEVAVDLNAVVDRKEAIVARWRAGVTKRLESAGERLTVVHAHARFVGAHTVEAAGLRYDADAIVINVGARPAIPKLPGIDDVKRIDSTGALALRELPSHLLVLGGGYVGCELGQMFRRFGARVTLIDHHEHLLSREDDDVSSSLEDALRDEGIHLALGKEVSRIESSAGAAEGEVRVHREGDVIAGSHLLVATGRRPNTDDLGCEAAGVTRDARGFIPVDDVFATNVAGVFAVGDVNGGPQFTHTAWDDHRLLFEHLMGRSARARSTRHVPYAVFTDPQVAGVGLGEREARAKGIAYEVATMPFANVARAAETDEPHGMLKVLVDPKTDRVLGARIVGAEAGELIHVFLAVMEAGASVRSLVDAEMVHPAFAEGIQSVAMRLPRFSLT